MAPPVNILLVDDQPAKLLAYEAILGELGEQLIKAASATEALKRLMEVDVAVILMDVCMPELDGFELAELIREHPRFQDAAIIFVSGVLVADIDRLRGYRMGAVDYVSVPIVPEILRAKVRVFTELFRKTRQLAALNRQLEQRVVERTAELHASEDRLREEDRRKDAFLATLSHELRTPLAPLVNGLDLLCRPEITASQRNSTHGVMRRQLEQMARLVNDLLDVSRITSDKIHVQRVRVDMSDVIDRAVETCRHTFAARRIRLERTGLDDFFVHGDSARLVQVVVNLLNNAAKYTDAGTVVIDTRRDGGELVLSVRDTGIGIAPEVLPRVFDLFTQGALDEDRKGGGLGIGLALVRRMIELHDGTVTAASAGLGQGSELVVRLPLIADASVEPAAELVASPSGVHRILVADDNPEAAEMLEALLQSCGHEVRSAGDGVAAVELAEVFRPDVAILDIGMPRLDGYGAARWIRAQPWGEGVLLVAQTGWGQPEDRRRAQEAGFDVHLTKPVSLERLERVLADAEATATAKVSSAE